MDVQCSYHSGFAQLEVAKKLPLNFIMQYAVFAREQQHGTENHQSPRNVLSGMLFSPATDLVGVIEFQRNFK
jgi:hypothetical protein